MKTHIIWTESGDPPQIFISKKDLLLAIYKMKEKMDVVSVSDLIKFIDDIGKWTGKE